MSSNGITISVNGFNGSGYHNDALPLVSLFRSGAVSLNHHTTNMNSTTRKRQKRQQKGWPSNAFLWLINRLSSTWSLRGGSCFPLLTMLLLLGGTTSLLLSCTWWWNFPDGIPPDQFSHQLSTTSSLTGGTISDPQRHLFPHARQTLSWSGTRSRLDQSSLSITTPSRTALTRQMSSKSTRTSNIDLTTFTASLPPFQQYSIAAPACTGLADQDTLSFTLVTQCSFTLVTQCSHDRLWMMEHHCARWTGMSDAVGQENEESKSDIRHYPISLVVYTSSNVTLSDIRQELDDYHCPGPELLTLQIVSHDDGDDNDGGDYPVNTLRNTALSAVTTTHVVYVDVDFWPSMDLPNNLQSPAVQSLLKQSHRYALVLPAFQMQRMCREWRDCREENLAWMPEYKENLVELLLNRTASAFDPTNWGGHGSTRYQDWINQDIDEELGDEDDEEEGEDADNTADAGSKTENRATEDSDAQQSKRLSKKKKRVSLPKVIPIECVKSNRYEPYLVFRYCHDLPPFQTAFTGYGKNKLTWVMHLRRLGYQFWQLGTSFLVHYPHLDSKARLAWNGGPNGRRIAKPKIDELLQYKRARNDQTFLEFRKWLGRNVSDQTKMGMCINAMDDDQKLWVDPSELKVVKQIEQRMKANKTATSRRERELEN